MNDLLVSYIRTGVPALIGAAGAYATAAGFDFDFEAFVIPLVGLLTTLYYALVRWAETQWPWFGKLLGVRKAVSYQDPT